jgi:hypothetical protein
MLDLKAHAHAACTNSKSTFTHKRQNQIDPITHVSAAGRMHYLQITTPLLTLNNRCSMVTSLSMQKISISLLHSQVKGQS